MISGARQRSERLGGVTLAGHILGQLPVPKTLGRTIRQRTIKLLRSFPELAPSNNSIFLVDRSTPKSTVRPSTCLPPLPNEAGSLVLTSLTSLTTFTSCFDLDPTCRIRTLSDQFYESSMLRRSGS